MNFLQIEGSGPLQVSLGEGHGKEHRFVFIFAAHLQTTPPLSPPPHDHLLLIMATPCPLLVSIIMVTLARNHISKGDDDNQPCLSG